MKRKLVFLFVILGIAGLIFVGFKLLSDRSPKTGVLRVNSSPTTMIFLDNKHIGRSNYEDKIEEGEYTLKLTPESTLQNVASWQGKIKIYKNLLTFVNAQLGDSEFNSSVDVLWLEKITSKQSELSVITNPDGATISLDGNSKGSTPLSIADVTPGDHTIMVTSPGFSARTVKVKTTAGYKLIATMKMALSAQVSGTNPVESTVSATATSSATISPANKITPTLQVSGTPKITPKVMVTITPTVKITPTPTINTKVSGTPKPTQPDPEKPFIIIKDTPTGFLRVRDNPSTSGTELAQVNPGDKFSILDTQNGWYKISYDGTHDGWVSGQYCEKVE